MDIVPNVKHLWSILSFYGASFHRLMFYHVSESSLQRVRGNAGCGTRLEKRLRFRTLHHSLATRITDRGMSARTAWKSSGHAMFRPRGVMYAWLPLKGRSSVTPDFVIQESTVPARWSSTAPTLDAVDTQYGTSIVKTICNARAASTVPAMMAFP